MRPEPEVVWLSELSEKPFKEWKVGFPEAEDINKKKVDWMSANACLARGRRGKEGRQ
jgi:hypothetical protein